MSSFPSIVGVSPLVTGGSSGTNSADTTPPEPSDNSGENQGTSETTPQDPPSGTSSNPASTQPTGDTTSSSGATSSNAAGTAQASPSTSSDQSAALVSAADGQSLVTSQFETALQELTTGSSDQALILARAAAEAYREQAVVDAQLEQMGETLNDLLAEETRTTDPMGLDNPPPE